MAKKSSVRIITAEDVLGFLTLLEGQTASKRDIAQHFHLKGREPRILLRRLLREMAEQGIILSPTTKTFRLPQGGEAAAKPAARKVKEVAAKPVKEPIVQKEKPAPQKVEKVAAPQKAEKTVVPQPQKVEQLPEILEVEVVGLNDDGELFCAATEEAYKGHFPLIILDLKSDAVIGDVLNVHLEKITEAEFKAIPAAGHKKAAKKEDEKPLMGVLREQRNLWVFLPLVKELAGVDFALVTPEDAKLQKQIKDGCVVLVKAGKRPSYGATPVTLLEIISDDIKGTESATVIRNHDLPHVFPNEVVEEAKKLTAITDAEIEGREDLRKVSLVTIDGADAKDFDDAVWAEPWDEVKGGSHIIVAIADVAHYVKQNSDLDKEGYWRGNSVYFPNMVIPMLPEELSNNLCSLRPDEDRLTLVAHMWVDAEGELKEHAFTRAVIRSHARLTYEQVQDYLDNPKQGERKPWADTVDQLFTTYQTLLKNRAHRGALDLDVPESFLNLDKEGSVISIEKRARKDSHRLIEEMMVLANVAAATTLQKKGAPCLYRVHPEPGRTKLENLQLSLKAFGLKVNLSGGVNPKDIQRVIARIDDPDESTALSMLVLRSQEQARYEEKNIGHFGLALERYAHFTSPIRRYSDLVVHRSLINTLKLAGYKGIKSPEKLSAVGEHLCITERRAQKAEWEMRDRLVTRYYSDFIDTEYEGRVITVTSFGMFVAIDDGAAEGLLPLRFMGDDYYIFDEQRQTLKGRRHGKLIKTGSTIQVKLSEADMVTGRLTFIPAKDAKTGGDSRKPRSRNKQFGRNKGEKPEGDTKSGYKGKGGKETASSTRKKYGKPFKKGDKKGVKK